MNADITAEHASVTSKTDLVKQTTFFVLQLYREHCNGEVLDVHGMFSTQCCMHLSNRVPFSDWPRLHWAHVPILARSSGEPSMGGRNSVPP